jgi:hypothetical protein
MNDYTDQLVQHYKIDLVGNHAYLNRAALVGCKNQLLSENLVNIPIFRSILKTAIDAYLHTQSVQTSLSRGDTKSMLYPQFVLKHISQ